MTDLTDEQTDAFAFLNRFVEGTERMACLAGYAGVGKTHLVSYWLQRIDRRRRLCVAAPTHQALKVLMQKCRGGRAIEFYTLAALLGEAPETDPRTGEDRFVAVNGRRDHHFDLIVVDESSMVNARVFAALCLSPAKVLFVGDPAQLPPVGDRHESPAFTLPAKFQMTRIVRQQAGNPIIDLSLMIREKMTSPGFVLVDDMRAALTDDRRRFNFCTHANLYPFAEWAYREGWRAPILAFKNETVIKHNGAMHARLYPDAPLFGIGEPLLSYETRWEGDAPVLYNGEVGTCLSCDPLGDAYGLASYRVTIQRENGERYTARVAQDENTMTAMKKEAARRAASLAKVAHTSANLQADHIAAVLKRDYLMGFVRLRHAYACTVHKSQGSTFDAAFMDWADIASARDAKMHYVAVTRAADCLVVAEPPPRAARGAASPAPRL